MTPRERAEALVQELLPEQPLWLRWAPTLHLRTLSLVEAAIIADRRERGAIPKAVAQDALRDAIETADNGDGTLDMTALEQSLAAMFEEHWRAAQADARRELLAPDEATVEAMAKAEALEALKRASVQTAEAYRDWCQSNPTATRLEHVSAQHMLRDRFNALALDDFAAAEREKTHRQFQRYIEGTDTITDLNLAAAVARHIAEWETASVKRGYDMAIKMLRNHSRAPYTTESPKHLADWLDANRAPEVK